MTIRNRTLLVVQRALRPLDISVGRWSQTQDALLARMLASRGVNRLIDVGAHRGGYVLTLRRAGWRGLTDSYEPDPRSYPRLASVAARTSDWRAHQVAVGEAEGLARFHLAENETSSSLAEVLGLHLGAAPRSQVAGAIEVPVQRLDALVSLGRDDIVMLKIDTQGSEADVLSGSSGILNQVSMLQVELSLRPLYRGQLLWKETVELIEGLGFHLGRIVPGFSVPDSGEMLQMDGIFLRS